MIKIVVRNSPERILFIDVFSSIWTHISHLSFSNSILCRCISFIEMMIFFCLMFCQVCVGLLLSNFSTFFCILCDYYKILLKHSVRIRFIFFFNSFSLVPRSATEIAINSAIFLKRISFFHITFTVEARTKIEIYIYLHKLYSCSLQILFRLWTKYQMWMLKQQ